MKGIPGVLAALAFEWLSCGSGAAQSLDNFDGPAVAKNWVYFSGDGVAAMRFEQRIVLRLGAPAWRVGGGTHVQYPPVNPAAENR